MSTNESTKKISKWYFGGVAASCNILDLKVISPCKKCFSFQGAGILTHPLELLKVQLQTQQEEKLSASQLTKNLIREKGVIALYNGISASFVRQMAYSLTRFGIYEVGKQIYWSGDMKSMSKIIPIKEFV